jgi:AcrR family transcriptional regulator
VDARALSPNQLDKRQQIVDAAKRVLSRDGLAGCTTRAVADASPLTRSAIHYYFDSAQEIVDAAMDDHLSDFIAAMRDAGSEDDEPIQRFWAVVNFQLSHFRTQRQLALLWFDYVVDSNNRGDREPARKIDAALFAVFHEKLEQAGVNDPAGRAQTLVGYMIGTTLRQIYLDDLHHSIVDELATLSTLAPPR